MRKGATGKALTPDITLKKGTETLAWTITNGTPAGMQNFEGDLTEKEIDVVARYIQHEPPIPPEFGMDEMKATWKVMVPVENRPTKKENSSICLESSKGIGKQSYWLFIPEDTS